MLPRRSYSLWPETLPEQADGQKVFRCTVGYFLGMNREASLPVNPQRNALPVELWKTDAFIKTILPRKAEYY